MNRRKLFSLAAFAPAIPIAMALPADVSIKPDPYFDVRVERRQPRKSLEELTASLEQRLREYNEQMRSIELNCARKGFWINVDIG